MKKFLILFFLFSISSPFFCDEQQNKKSYLLTENEKSERNQKTIIGKQFTKPEDFKGFLNQVDFNIQMSSSIYVNTQSPLVSAPSPILFPFTIGFSWPNYTFWQFNLLLVFLFLTVCGTMKWLFHQK